MKKRWKYFSVKIFEEIRLNRVWIEGHNKNLISIWILNEIIWHDRTTIIRQYTLCKFFFLSRMRERDAYLQTIFVSLRSKKSYKVSFIQSWNPAFSISFTVQHRLCAKLLHKAIARRTNCRKKGGIKTAILKYRLLECAVQ